MMFKTYAIPLLSGLALSSISTCPAPGDPSPSPSVTPTPTVALPLCQPSNDSVWDVGSYDLETGETSDYLSCPDLEASCCPTSSPSQGADPLAGTWAVDGYVGGAGPCGGQVFKASAPKPLAKSAEPQTCGGSAEGEMILGDSLRGCMDLYVSSSSSSYAPDIDSTCGAYDISVAATPQGRSSYAITLITTEDSLDLSCSLEGDRLSCSDEDGHRWNFKRP